jgi:hypothetical protein
MEGTLALLNLLERILGTGERRSKGNYAFYCPNCKHHKRKLEVNLELHRWSCWVCGNKDNFKGKTISSLIKRLKVTQDIIDELHLILPHETKVTEVTVNHDKCHLPKEFINLHNFAPGSRIEFIKIKQAIHFLLSRNITKEDVIKYHIGICFEGDYADRIIIPSFDSNGILNYFTARDFTGNLMEKYKNPKSPIRDIIPFELYINWNAPIILTEGMIDAITIKRNVVPLCGKVIQDGLMRKLVESKVNKIYMALDMDANKDALQYCEQLLNFGKEVYMIDLDGKDANEIGHDRFFEITENTVPLTFANLIQRKLEKT